MSLTISKSTCYQILYTICVGVPYINIYELTFAVWLVALFLTLQQKYSYSFFNYLLPYIAILFLAFFPIFFYNYEISLIIRDITYLLKPIIGMIIGYQLCKSLSNKVILTIIYAGVFIAVIHLTIIFYSAILHKIINIHVLRGYGGYFSDYEVYSLVILIFYKNFQLNFSKKRLRTLILILGFSSFLYVSRTNFIQLFLFYMTLKGFFRINLRSITIVSIFIIVSCIGYAVLYNIPLSRNGKGIEALLFKIKNAPIEAFKTKIDQDDYQDFNDNYRSFENIKTVKQVSRAGTPAILFGKGLGSTMKIGRVMRSNDGGLVRNESILHNAYMTVFLKSGLLGVACLIYSMYVLMFHKKSEDEMINQINLLLLATGIFLIFENWVLLGIFLKTESKAVLIGFIICYREILSKRLATDEK